MKSYPDASTVVDGLGDKVVEGLGRSVALAVRDLRVYPSTFPAWVAEASERGLANWIHDRVWFHLNAALDSMPGVVITDREPNREITVGLTYRLRIKRHHDDGQISTYWTQTALEYFAQGPVQVPLDGMEEVRLAAGYKWDRETRAIGDAVLSLRDGLDNVLWEELLPLPEDLGGGEITIPPVPGPTPPTIAGPATGDSHAQGQE